MTNPTMCTCWRCKIEKPLADFPERNVGEAMRPEADWTHSNPGPGHTCRVCFPAMWDDIARLYVIIHRHRIERQRFREERASRRAALDRRIARLRKVMQRDLDFEATPERQASRRMWEAITRPRPIKRRTRTAEQERRARIAEENMMRFPRDPFMWKC